MEFLNEYMVPVIVAICLCAGYVVKRWIDDVDNRWIPTICAVLGLALSVWINWGAVTPEAIASGLLSGLAAVGLHQAFKQTIEGGKRNV